MDVMLHGPLQLLLVEDNVTDVELVRAYLKRSGVNFTLNVASTVSAAKAEISECHAFDAILLDLGLPDSNRSETFYDVQGAVESRIPIIVFTGNEDERLVDRLLADGAQDYIVKSDINAKNLAGAIRHAVLRTQARREFDANAERQSLLAGLGEVALGDSTIDALQEAVCDAVAKGLQVEHVGILLPLVEAGELEVASARGWKSEAIGQRVKMGGNTQCGICFELGKTVLVDDYSSETRFVAAPFFLEHGLRSGISTVIACHSQQFGVLSAACAGPRTFVKDEVNFFETAAHLLAMAMDRARTRREVDVNLGRLQSLRAIDIAICSSLDVRAVLSTVLHEVRTQLQIDAACVLLRDPDSRQLTFSSGSGFRSDALKQTRLMDGEGFAGQVVARREPLFVSDLALQETSMKHSSNFLSEGFRTYCAVPLIAKGTVEGVMELFSRTPFKPSADWMDFLEALAQQTAIGVHSARMFAALEQQAIKLVRGYESTLEGWSAALDLKDQETEGHSLRVTDMTLRLAAELGISGSSIVDMRRGALLHDIGKMGIPDAILLKPGPLTTDEWKIMRSHPVLAFDLLSRIDFIGNAIDIPYCHHERWDGTGYPRGLKNTQIPLAARAFAAVDVWDALTSNRPYRGAWHAEKALEYIKQHSGTHFDPDVVQAFCRLPNVEALGMAGGAAR